ncbi:DUF2477 domain-containing protein [Streptomyces sp. PsTaAH-124]|uniref:DUF2477 domain-containing protein n=1 Tax=Streptomyces sp. PsTaAH-124 TaxID=1157638 RepID=UPI000375EB9B|nr:DUF2477 domain-containing protein [Streptomyces sp. PsTaAH-124]
MRRALPLVLLLAAGLGLTLCGDRAGTWPPGGSTAGGRDTQPLDAFELTDAEQDTVTAARWTLAAQCMRRLGFDSLADVDPRHPPGPPQRPADAFRTVLTLVAVSDDAHRYGVQDPADAAAHGYRGALAAYRAHAREKTWTMPEYVALTGSPADGGPARAHGRPVPDGGCLGEAERRIRGTGSRTGPDPVSALRGESRRRAEQNPAWQRADRTWSACMRGAGYHYATPADAQRGDDRREEDLRLRLSGERGDPDLPTGAEKRTAVADARCKQRTGYLRTVRALDARAQERLIAGHRAELDRHHASERAAVRTAGRVLAGGTP